jgi:hypothetical protein
LTQPVPSVLPAVTGDVLGTPAPVLRTDRVASLVEEVWGLPVGTVRPLSSERDANVLLDGRYVLKVSNPAEDPAVVDMENTAMAHAVGIDITGAPHTPDVAGRRAFARALLDALRDHHALAGLTGPDGTVLKIRPPLIWHTSHADLFTTALAESLTTIG